MDEIRVLVVDDHPLFREGVVRSISDEPGMTVAGEADSADSALEKAKDALPDIVLLDLKLPGGGGLDVLQAMASECPYSKIVVLTAVEDENVLLQALKRGAKGYLVKGISSQELVRVVRAVSAGETYVSPSMAGRLLQEQVAGRHAKGYDADYLTDRETSILELVAQGLTNREIADSLYLSEKTIKHYMTNILEKLHVRNRVEAALILAKERAGL